MLLRYYLWRGAEGCAAASHSSSHICGISSHIRGAVSCHLVSNNNTCAPDIFSLENACSKKKVADFLIKWQVTMRSLPAIETVNPENDYRGFGHTCRSVRCVFIIQMAYFLFERTRLPTRDKCLTASVKISKEVEDKFICTCLKKDLQTGVLNVKHIDEHTAWNHVRYTGQSLPGGWICGSCPPVFHPGAVTECFSPASRSPSPATYCV